MLFEFLWKDKKLTLFTGTCIDSNKVKWHYGVWKMKKTVFFRRTDMLRHNSNSQRLFFMFIKGKSYEVVIIINNQRRKKENSSYT